MRCAGKAELHNVRSLGKNRMHRALQIADAFAMNDADLQNPLCRHSSRLLIPEQGSADFPRFESVQIQQAVNRKYYRRRIGRILRQFTHGYDFGCAVLARTMISVGSRGAVPRALLGAISALSPSRRRPGAISAAGAPVVRWDPEMFTQQNVGSRNPQPKGPAGFETPWFRNTLAAPIAVHVVGSLDRGH